MFFKKYLIVVNNKVQQLGKAQTDPIESFYMLG